MLLPRRLGLDAIRLDVFVSLPDGDGWDGGSRDEVDDVGMRRRQKTHGRMKYRGSTSGAVTSESVVATRSISTVDVGGDSTSGSTSFLARFCVDTTLAAFR